MGKTINQSITFKASAHDVYEALMDSKKHAEFTKAPAEISTEVGGTFSVHGDYITGENLELEQDKKIVQKWRASEWPEGHYSTVTFELEEKDGSTELTFTHENVPDVHADSITKGWEEHYWKPMKEMLE